MPDGGSFKRALPAGLAPRWLTKEQACAFFGVGAEAFESHILPRLRPQRWGRAVRFDLHELHRLSDALSFAESLPPGPALPPGSNLPPNATAAAQTAADKAALHAAVTSPSPVLPSALPPARH